MQPLWQLLWFRIAFKCYKRVNYTHLCQTHPVPNTHTYTRTAHSDHMILQNKTTPSSHNHSSSTLFKTPISYYTQCTQHQSLQAPLTGCHHASMSLHVRQAWIYAHHASTQHRINTREKPNVGNITPVTFCRSCANMRSCAQVSYHSKHTVTRWKCINISSMQPQCDPCQNYNRKAF